MRKNVPARDMTGGGFPQLAWPARHMPPPPERLVKAAPLWLIFRRPREVTGSIIPRSTVNCNQNEPGNREPMNTTPNTTPSSFPPPESVAKSAWVDAAGYARMYEQSIKDPEAFWGEQGKRLDWIRPYTHVKDVSFTGDVHIRWFYDGTLNVSANCIDRHLADKADQTAIIWEGDNPAESRHITYRELHEQVCRLANVLKAKGVKKGDRVTIYLPMIPEAAYAMLACARVGAIHSIVFGGFSPDSLRDRLVDCDSHLLITADEGLRGGRKVPLKKNADEALKQSPASRPRSSSAAPAAPWNGPRAATSGTTRRSPRSRPRTPRTR